MDLYRTLTQKPHLAQRTHSLDLLLFDWACQVEILTSDILAHGEPLTTCFQCVTTGANLAGAILSLMPNLENLTLFMMDADTVAESSSGRLPMMRKPMEALYPGLRSTPNRELLTGLPGLHKVKRLSWHGSEFHWLLIKSPFLEYLKL